MKKLYILSLCALIGASSVMAASRFKTQKSIQRKSVFKTEKTSPVWRAESATEYVYADGEWMKLTATSYKYDSRGNTIQQISEDEDIIFRTDTEYNEYDRPVSVLGFIDEGDGWENSSKRTYVYDPVVHDFYTERLGFDWEEGEWVRNYFCETNIVTRNDDGNITEIQKVLPFMDDMVPAYKAVWDYDPATGRANGFSYYTYDSFSGTPSWELYNATAYRNIVWDATDGQMTQSSVYDFVTGANRIQSCEIYYEDELDGYFIVEYSADKPGEYLVKETFSDPELVGTTTRYELIDENGSFRITDSEYLDEDFNPTEEPTYEMVQEVIMDEHGNTVEESMYETFEGMTELVSGTKAEYLYDADGNPSEVTVSYYDYDADGYVPDTKTVYGTYVDAGVNNVTADDAAANGFTVYNIQGMFVRHAATAEELDSLPAGLYIVNGTKRLIRGN